MHAIIEHAQCWHPLAMLPQVREIDRLEALAVGFSNVAQGLVHSISASSWVKTGLVDGEPVCIFGVAPLSGSVGAPWLVTTHAINQVPLTFLRGSRRMVADMHQLFDRLENHVHADNYMAIKWLEWLGFNLDTPAPHGPMGEPFLRFWRENEACATSLG